MSDGAHLGMNPESALDAVMGGPQDGERMTVEAMRARILAATPEDASTYGGTGTYAAKLILEYFLANPTRAMIPTESVYDDETGKVITLGLYSRMEEDGIDLDALGLSGFLWGWAVNAARRCGICDGIHGYLCPIESPDPLYYADEMRAGR